MLSDLHFLRPYWFFALLPLFLIITYIYKRQLLNRHWESVCDSALLPYILIGKTGSKRYVLPILVTLAGLLSIISLAGPAWERLPQPVYQRESALVIALDLSYSMYADDIKPSRLERARFKIADLLNMRKEGQTALLVYAGSAFTVTPLTDDIRTIKSQLNALSPDIMPAPGSHTAKAVEHAVNLLKQAGMKQGHILFITDEVSPAYEDSFSNAKNEGYLISIMALGTKEGAPIKLSNGEFLEDRSGNIVIPKVDISQLQELAQTGGGKFVELTVNDSDINQLNAFFNMDISKEQEQKTEFQSDQWQDAGIWFVLLLLPIMVFSFRRGFLFVFFAAMFIHPDHADAVEWQNWFLNKNQQAMRALDDNDNTKAADLFQDENWKATAKYRANDYPATAKLLKDKTDVRSLYNRGNALAKEGRYEEAIAAYDEVLKQEPRHEDARFNKDLVEKELKKQEQQQQQSSEDEKNSQDNQQSENSEDQSGSESESQQSDKGEQDSQQQAAKDSNNDGEADNNQQQSSSPDSSNNDNRSGSDATQEQQAESESNEEAQEKDENKTATTTPQQAMNEIDEEQQASEQWLRRIPDDPAGLLRRKFQYQYKQQRQESPGEKYW